MTTIAPEHPDATLCCVGIDVAKAHLDIAIAGTLRRIDYTPRALAGLVEQLAHLREPLIVLEASGGYERLCADTLAEAGFAVAVANPRRVRAFARSLGQLAKPVLSGCCKQPAEGTDAIDARMLALYGARIRPAKRHRPDPARARLCALDTRRRQLVAMRAAERQRLDLADPAIARAITRHVRQLERDIAAVDEAIDKVITAHPIWSILHRALQTIPGIGRQTATVLIVAMPELGYLNRREAAALGGLAPINRDSGANRGHRFVQGGRQTLKTALYMAALAAARCHPTLKHTYASLRQAGKPPKVALIAIARKLLLIANALAKQLLPAA
jgi:transposase